MRTYHVFSVLSDTIEEDRIAEYGGIEGQDYKNSLAYPHLREYVDDESQMFVVNAEDSNDFYNAEEFLFQTDQKEFRIKFL